MTLFIYSNYNENVVLVKSQVFKVGIILIGSQVFKDTTLVGSQNICC